MAGFDKDTRYSVRRAEREGVEVTIVGDATDQRPIDDLHALVAETQARAGFPLPPLERYRVAWRALAGAGRAAILEARREGELLASGMVVIGGRSVLLPVQRLPARGARRAEALRELRAAVGDDAAGPLARLAQPRPVGRRTARCGAGALVARRRAVQEGLRRPRGALGRVVGPRRRPDAVPAARRDAHRSRVAATIAPMSMGLGALTDVIGPERVIGIPVGEVTSLAYDSRRVTPGALFFAVPGVHVDGHDFVVEAIASGAVGVVVEREVGGRIGPAARGGEQPPCAGRCRRPLVRAAERAADGRRRHRHRWQVDGHRPRRRDAVGMRAPRRGRSGRCQVGVGDDSCAERGAQHDPRSTRAPGAAGADGRGRQRQRGDGGDVARPGAGPDAQLPLRRRCRDDGDERASRVPRHRRGLPRRQGAPGRGGADRRPQRRRRELAATSASARRTG